MLLTIKSHIQHRGLHHVQALAIFAVVFYHLLPKYFPNGYFGIDIFFVTSGYSMALNQISTKTDILNFYVKQIQRFVPLYFSIIIFHVCGSFFLHEPGHYFQLVWETLWAVGFTKNQQIIDYNFNYEQFIFVEASLLHGWLLSVLKYFIIYAPLVSYLSAATKKLVWILIVVAADSFWTYFGNASSIAGLVTFFPRLWQFLFGTFGFLLIQHLNNNNPEKNEIFMKHKKSIFIGSVILLCCCLFYPFHSNLYSVGVRFVVTLSATLCIISSFSMKKKSLVDYVIQYVSEASYVTYIIHYPLISSAFLIHYINIPYIGFKAVLLFLTITMTFLIQEFFQKLFNKASKWILFIYIIISYLLIMYFCCYLLVIPLY